MYFKVGLAIASAVVLGPKVEAWVSGMVKPEGDFATKAVHWGAPIGTGLGTFMLAETFLGKKG